MLIYRHFAYYLVMRLYRHFIYRLFLSIIIINLFFFLAPAYAHAKNLSIVSAGAGAVLDDIATYFTTWDISEHSEEVLSAGEAAAEYNTVSSDISGIDQDNDGTIAGYTNLGIANVKDHLNIRKEPDENAELVGKMTKHAACEILDVSGNWAHISSGKVEGFCNTEFLYTGEKAKEVAEEEITLVATIKTTTLFVRENPSTDAAIVTMVPIDEEYVVTEGDKTSEWLKIEIDEDQGYVSSEYVTLAEQLDKAMNLTELKYGEGISDVRVSLVNYAKQFIGHRYVWGGTSLTKGADCSGYVQSIFRKYGVYLPRTSASQSTVGKKISPSDAQPGDLFFYARRGRIGHVGIYIGGGQIVNAHSRRTGIRIDNAYYRKPAVVRRVLD